MSFLIAASVQTHVVRVARCDEVGLRSLMRRSIQILARMPFHHGFQSAAALAEAYKSSQHFQYTIGPQTILSRIDFREVPRPFSKKTIKETHVRMKHPQDSHTQQRKKERKNNRRVSRHAPSQRHKSRKGFQSHTCLLHPPSKT